MATIAGKDVGTNDLGVMGAGIVVFIASLLPWFGVSAFGISVSRNAWGTGFLSWFSVLLGLAALVVVVLRIFTTTDLSGLPVGQAVLVLLLSGAGFALCLLKILIGYHGTERKVGIVLGLIALGVEAAFAFRAFQVSGEKLPEFGGNHPA